MHALAPSELLEAWDHGLSRPPSQRALVLLVASCPDRSPAELARLSIGRRDELLLALRELTFGPRFEGLATCPACGGRIETNFLAADIRAKSGAVEEVTSFEFAEHQVRFRLPNSLDLATIETGNAPANGRQQLLERCVISASRDGLTIAATDLPEPVIASLCARMVQADPQADVRLDLRCPQCAHRWLATFDLAAFFWGEIQTWALRQLREVHELASAYGWSETDILALSAPRRRAYLEILQS